MEDVLKDAETSEGAVNSNDQGAGDSSSDLVNGLPHLGDLEDGEIEDDQADHSSNVASESADTRIEIKACGHRMVPRIDC